MKNLKSVCMHVLVVTLIATVMITGAACGGADTTEVTTANMQSTTVAETTATPTTEMETSEKSSETFANLEMTVSTDDASVDLPAEYPMDVLPIYAGSYIEGVVSMDGGFTVIAHSKDEPEKLSGYYKEIMSKGQVIAQTSVNGSFTIMGILGDYNVQLTVGPEQDRDDFQSAYALMLTPA